MPNNDCTMLFIRTKISTYNIDAPTHAMCTLSLNLELSKIIFEIMPTSKVIIICKREPDGMRIDIQVQSHLETLSDAVHGMDEAMKQVVEIQEWINVHNALARDWLANPSKLRPEAAKQDIAAMSDALVSLGEKRQRLFTEIPTDGTYIFC